MALLLLARSVFPGLVAFHVDHGTRAGASTRDAAWLRRRCRALDIPLSVKKLRIEPGPGFESRARAARYAAFESMARAGGITHLLLAHHADDQAETVALRMQRGSGARGLGAMQVRRVTASGLVLCRPFLAVRREELRRVLAELGSTWREDLTNALPITDRNILRSQLRGDHATHRQLLRVAHAAATLHRRALTEVRRTVPARCLVREPGFVAVRTARVREVPPRLHAALIEYLLGLNAPLLRRDHATFSRALLRASLRAHLSGGWRLEQDGQWLVLSAPAVCDFLSAVRAPTAAGFTARERQAQHAVLRFTLRQLTRQRAVDAALAAARKDPTRAVLALAPDRLVQFRTAQRYRPLGANGSKLLSDALRERGIPRALRRDWPLLQDAVGFLWAPGLVPAERARVVSAPAWAITSRGPFLTFVRGKA